MQSPPWKLVVQAYLHLELEPHALLDMEPGCETRTCRPLSIARARVSHHFLYLGSFNRLFKMLHYCIYDMSHVRSTSVGVSLAVVRLAKSTDDTPIGQAGKISFAERHEKRRIRSFGPKGWRRPSTRAWLWPGERHGQAENDLRDISARLTALEQRIK
jgi:hypothetical protein